MPKVKAAITVNQYRKDQLPAPPAGWEPLCYVDATPDEDYVLRILKAHRDNCRAKWAGTPNRVLAQLNQWQEERYVLLNKAIRKLLRGRR